ncbi:MAG TPA: class I SAM-dependent methyltransferase [Candidatus Lokiarchaeia archaeon]|nr:class I SAM-dependent methyltransferase [Candidatus Lokiarchaeia archaeon]
MHDDGAAERRHWNDRYSSKGHGEHGPSEFLVKYSRLLPRTGIALDIACGTGENALFLANYLDIVGVDISDVAIDIANQGVTSTKPRHQVSFVNADAREMLANEDVEKYDLVTCINFFEPAIIDDVKRVLKRSGTVIIQAYTTLDERMATSTRMQPLLVTDTTYFEPAMFGSYWIMVHEIENFIDKAGLHRQRANMLARKP